MIRHPSDDRAPDQIQKPEGVSTLGQWQIGSERGTARIALEGHNSAYSTGFLLRGRAEDVYPDLRGQQNWDWVCIDDSSGIEGAIEVKRLTKELPEKVHGYFRKVGRDVSSKVGDRLSGSFLLYVDILDPQHVKMDSEARQGLINGLANVVLEMAAKVSDDKPLTSEVRDNGPLSEVLPQGSCLDLHKIDPSGLKPEARRTNFLHINFGWASFGATERLSGHEFVDLQKLVRNANDQLGVAKQRGIRETFLVLAELGYSGADPNAVESTLHGLDPSEYCRMNHIYLVGFNPARRIGGTHGFIGH